MRKILLLLLTISLATAQMIRPHPGYSDFLLNRLERNNACKDMYTSDASRSNADLCFICTFINSWEIGLSGDKLRRVCGRLDPGPMESILDNFLEIGKAFKDNDDEIGLYYSMLTLKNINEALGTEGVWESNHYEGFAKSKHPETCCNKYYEFAKRLQSMANSRVKKLKNHIKGQL